MVKEHPPPAHRSSGAQTTGRSDHREIGPPGAQAPRARETRGAMSRSATDQAGIQRGAVPGLEPFESVHTFPKRPPNARPCSLDRTAWTVQSEGRQTVGTSAAPHSLQSRHQSDTERPAPVHPAPRSPSGTRPRAGNLPGDENAGNPKFEVYLAYHLC